MSVIYFMQRKDGTLYGFNQHPIEKIETLKETINKHNAKNEYDTAIYVTQEDDSIKYNLAAQLVAITQKLYTADSIFDCLDNLSTAIDDCNDHLRDFYNREGERPWLAPVECENLAMLP